MAALLPDRPAVGWLAGMIMLACGAAAGLWIALLAWGLWLGPRRQRE